MSATQGGAPGALRGFLQRSALLPPCPRRSAVVLVRVADRFAVPCSIRCARSWLGKLGLMKSLLVDRPHMLRPHMEVSVSLAAVSTATWTPAARCGHVRPNTACCVRWGLATAVAGAGGHVRVRDVDQHGRHPLRGDGRPPPAQPPRQPRPADVQVRTHASLGAFPSSHASKAVARQCPGCAAQAVSEQWSVGQTVSWRVLPVHARAPTSAASCACSRAPPHRSLEWAIGDASMGDGGMHWPPEARILAARRLHTRLPSISGEFRVSTPLTRIRCAAARSARAPAGPLGVDAACGVGAGGRRSDPLLIVRGGTPCRDIAHRNDIPKDLKDEIKHTLQNKLHRSAGTSRGPCPPRARDLSFHPRRLPPRASLARHTRSLLHTPVVVPSAPMQGLRTWWRPRPCCSASPPSPASTRRRLSTSSRSSSRSSGSSSTPRVRGTTTYAPPTCLPSLPSITLSARPPQPRHLSRLQAIASCG